MPLAPLRIAHAGGGLHDRIYNNSEKALRHNQGNFTWFELDFIWSTTGPRTLNTDAERAAVTSSTTGGYYNAKDENLADPAKLGDTENLSLEQLYALMMEFPKMCVVTDVKSENVEALALIKASMPTCYADRIIPQIYQPEEYEPIVALGFKNIIWTLYNYAGSDDDALAELAKMELTCVTIPQARAESGFSVRCGQAGLKVMTHTINDPAVLKTLQDEHGITEVYSDFLVVK